jgi:2-deoxy-scyllo-inosamine dehydrogenase (SAM-dependent)
MTLTRVEPENALEGASPHATDENCQQLFRIVEIEINSRCNKRCSYCPVSQSPPVHLQRYMAAEVLDRILAELSRLDFDGRLSYHFYNEPLLHPQLLDIVGQVTERVTGARQVLYTNGDLLKDDLYQGLIAAGIKRFIVTSHDHKVIPERPNQVVLFPEDLEITNRGGALGTPAGQLDLPCHAPGVMLIVTVTGDVVLCYEDYYRTQLLGNVMDKGLDAIWYSPRFQMLRAALAQGDRSVTSICAACSNKTHQTPVMFDYVL